MQECIRCLEHSPEGTPEAGTHYKCTGAIYEAEHTLKYLAQKEMLQCLELASCRLAHGRSALALRAATSSMA